MTPITGNHTGNGGHALHAIRPARALHAVRPDCTDRAANIVAKRREKVL